MGSIWSKIGKILLVVIVLAIVGGGGYFGYYYYTKYQAVKKNPDIITKEETNYLVDQVGKLMTLPGDEVPTIATVIDKEKLKDQSFFANSQNGDKVLVYVKAKKAILYRPNTNKIVEVGPVNTDQAADGVTANIKVAYLNGSKSGNTDTLVAAAEAKVKEKINNSETASKAAAKGTYTKTQLIDLSSGTYTDAVKQLADVLGGDVATLPAGETKPDGNILIILAQ